MRIYSHIAQKHIDVNLFQLSVRLLGGTRDDEGRVEVYRYGFGELDTLEVMWNSDLLLERLID